MKFLIQLAASDFYLSQGFLFSNSDSNPGFRQSSLRSNEEIDFLEVSVKSNRGEAASSESGRIGTCDGIFGLGDENDTTSHGSETLATKQSNIEHPREKSGSIPKLAAASQPHTSSESKRITGESGVEPEESTKSVVVPQPLVRDANEQGHSPRSPLHNGGQDVASAEASKALEEPSSQHVTEKGEKNDSPHDGADDAKELMGAAHTTATDSVKNPASVKELGAHPESKEKQRKAEDGTRTSLGQGNEEERGNHGPQDNNNRDEGSTAVGKQVAPTDITEQDHLRKREDAANTSNAAAENNSATEQQVSPTVSEATATAFTEPVQEYASPQSQNSKMIKENFDEDTSLRATHDVQATNQM